MCHFLFISIRVYAFSALLAFFGPLSASATNPAVSIDDMRAAIAAQSATVIDIRETFEHATGVAKGVTLIPMSSLAKRIGELPKSTDKPLLVICNTQNRSSKIVDQLHAAGYTNARYVHGGMSQWNARGLPTIKP